jgi:hypothetical protein
MEEQHQEAAAALLKVFSMLKCMPGNAIKIGSIGERVQMLDVGRVHVPGGITRLWSQGLLIQQGPVDWYLTELGWEKVREMNS